MILSLLSMVWSLSLLIFWLLINKDQRARFYAIFSIQMILAIGLVVRLIPAFVLASQTNYDIESFSLVSVHILNLEDVYTSSDTITRHPYLPLQIYWLGASQWVSEKTTIPFSSLVRLLPIMADMVIVWLLFTYFRKNNKVDPKYAALLYAVNPIAVYVSAYHGQFDSVPLLFVLLSLICAGNSVTKSGFWLGMGIWIKSWPVLAFPAIMSSFSSKNDKYKLLLNVLLAPLFGILFYSIWFSGGIMSTISNAINYNHGIGHWGYTFILKMIGSVAGTDFINNYLYLYSKFVTLLALFLVWFCIARKQAPITAVTTIIVAFLAFTHAFAVQYLVWILPLAILDIDFKWLRYFTIAGIIYMFLVYQTVIVDHTLTNLLPFPLYNQVLINPSEIPVWLVSLAWIISRIKNPKSQEPEPIPLAME